MYDMCSQTPGTGQKATPGALVRDTRCSFGSHPDRAFCSAQNSFLSSIMLSPFIMISAFNLSKSKEDNYLFGGTVMFWTHLSLHMLCAFDSARNTKLARKSLPGTYRNKTYPQSVLLTGPPFPLQDAQHLDWYQLSVTGSWWACASSSVSEGSRAT